MIIYYRNQRMSWYTLQTAAQKENVSLSEALICNAKRDADAGGHNTHNTSIDTHIQSINNDA